MPHDNFDIATVQNIQTDLDQYHVQQNPQDHEVYMITGGLGIANPRIMSWDSLGNMTFGGNQDGWIYTFQETAESPATWYMQPQGKGIMWTNGPEKGFKPVPWILKYTESRTPYYEWDMIKYQTTQFYFKTGATYIVLKDDSAMNQHAAKFPEGLMSHLVPLGNPVAKK